MNTWTKLNDGTWGVKCDVPQVAGTVVAVTNRAGESKQVTLGLLAYGPTVRAPGYVYAVAQAPKAAAPQAQAVGDLGGVLALFARTKGKIKRPAIVVAVPGPYEGDLPTIKLTYRVSVAGPSAKVPGSLTVTTDEKVWNRFENEFRREWLERVRVDGTYEPSRAANGRTDTLVASLREFAQDPAGAAKRSARLTGRCVFCNANLGGKNPDSAEGQKSLAVGYGRTCARNYGLPWGEEKYDFRAEATNAERR